MHFLATSKGKKPKQLVWKTLELVLWVKYVGAQGGQACSFISSKRSERSVITPASALCAFSCLSFGSSHQARAPEEPQGLDFTWRLSLGYTWKGGLKREKAREKPHCGPTWGMWLSLRPPALSKSLATETGDIRTSLHQQRRQQILNYYSVHEKKKKGRTVDHFTSPLMFASELHIQVAMDDIKILTWSARKYLWLNALHFHFCTIKPIPIYLVRCYLMSQLGVQQVNKILAVNLFRGLKCQCPDIYAR